MFFIAFNQEFLVTVSTNSLNFQKSIVGGVWTTERLSKVCSRKTRFIQFNSLCHCAVKSIKCVMQDSR